MYNIGDLQNESRKIVAQYGRYQLLELVKNPSVWPSNVVTKYFMDKVNYPRLKSWASPPSGGEVCGGGRA